MTTTYKIDEMKSIAQDIIDFQTQNSAFTDANFQEMMPTIVKTWKSLSKKNVNDAIYLIIAFHSFFVTGKTNVTETELKGNTEFLEKTFPLTA